MKWKQIMCRENIEDPGMNLINYNFMNKYYEFKTHKIDKNKIFE